MRHDIGAVAPDRRLRWPLVGAGAAVVAIAALRGFIHLPFDPLTSWMLAMAGVACAICGAAMGGPWRSAAVMGAALWLGVSAQLALTEPNWFQSLRLLPQRAFDGVLLAAIAAQALAAVLTLRAKTPWSSYPRALRSFGPGRAALMLLLLAALAAGAGRLIANHAFGHLTEQFVLSWICLGVNLAGIVALGASLPAASLARLGERAAVVVSLPGSPEAVRAFDRWLPWAAAGVVLVLSAALNLLAFGGAPHLPDEIAYLFQARYMAHGAIAVAAPPEAIQPSLSYSFLIERGGRWFAVTAPGWPAVLAIGVRVGLPWLVNPVLGAFAVLMAHSVTARLSSRGAANVVAVLMAASPWFIESSATLMTHTLTLALPLAAVRLLIAARDGRWWLAFAAGAAMGLVFLARPVDGLIVGVLAGLWTLTFLPKPGGWRVVIAYGLGCIALAALIFPYNAVLMGDPLLPPLTAYQDALWGKGSNRMGFGPDIGPPNLWGGVDLYRGHSPFEALLLTQLAGYSANFELFGWPGLSLALGLAWAVWGVRRRFELAMAAMAAIVVIVLFFYWYSDIFYIGPRYWLIALPALIVLSAAGLTALVERLRRAEVSEPGPRVGATLAGLCLFGLIAFLPWRATMRFHDHRGFHDRYAAIARAHPGALVFMSAAAETDMASALAMNSPFLEPEKAVFLRDKGAAARAAVIAAMPGRPVFYSTGRGPGGAAPTLTTRAPGS